MARLPEVGGNMALGYATGGILFKWEGGEYIDVYVKGEEYPRDTINVWNYKENRPVIPYELTAFIAECEDWLEGGQ